MIHISKFFGSVLLVGSLVFAPTASFAGVFVGINVNFAPPALPAYVQPPCPAPDLVWTPGYWAYSDYSGYYWVPGTWVAAPQVGYLWTPGYWGYASNVYGWHSGYWGPHVGFYGGVNYGYGYFGSGFYGGGWFGNHYRYNTAYANVNTTIVHNTYVNNTTIVNNYTTSNVERVSYNGGPSGVRARPTPEELAYRGETHIAPTAVQQRHIESASQNRALLATVNHGRPAEAAIERPAYARALRATNDPYARFDRTPSYREPPATYRAPGTTYRAPKAYHAPATRVEHAPPAEHHESHHER